MTKESDCNLCKKIPKRYTSSVYCVLLKSSEIYSLVYILETTFSKLTTRNYMLQNIYSNSYNLITILQYIFYNIYNVVIICHIYIKGQIKTERYIKAVHFPFTIKEILK